MEELYNSFILILFKENFLILALLIHKSEFSISLQISSQVFVRYLFQKNLKIRKYR